MKTRAAVLRVMGSERPYARTRPMQIEELELDPPGAGEALIRICAAGLCHSDLSVIDGKRPRPLPIVLGHEGAGEVVEIGPGVHDLKAGDHVISTFVPSCGRCTPCSAGRPALCEPAFTVNTDGTLLSGARRLRDGRGPVNHFLGVSAFAEYATVARNSLVKVDSSLPFDEAAVFGCAVMTGVGAVVNTAQMPRGASVAVFGLGGVGLAALLGARHAEARTIVAVDFAAEKLAMARELGATHAVNAGSANCLEAIRDASQGGVEYAYEMAGSVPALELAYRATRRGGTTVTAGLPDLQARISIAPSRLVTEERCIRGSFMGSCIPERDIPRFIDWYRSGALPVDRLLTGERLALADINAGFDRLADGRTARQILQP
jgi:alcohol dehydrogenase